MNTIDTKHIQLKSLINFMQALDYEYGDHGFYCYFWSENPKNKHRSFVSFNSAVKWHNNSFLDWHGKRYREPWNVDAYTFNKAYYSKIVQTVKLQYSKKKHATVCQSNIICFLREEYVDIFLKEVE
ncbi:hypothetical protein D3C85_293150 [compost metagenome]